MTSLSRRIETAHVGVVWAAAAAAVGLPLAALPWADPLQDGALIALSALGVVAALGAGLLRLQAARLPLEISERALVEALDEERTLRFRVRLGRGRVISRVRQRLVWVHEGGEEELLPLVIPGAAALVGPWTPTARVPAGAPRDGRLVLTVSGSEGARRWSAERSWTWSQLTEGRFHPGFHTEGGRLTLDPERWDAPQPV
ncbi:MAG: hypothetical protein JXX28_01645 [Deltaproteobacteria bacterium]|nr:hypothetical protein [Deltaproteobacteria bacterium]